MSISVAPLIMRLSRLMNDEDFDHWEKPFWRETLNEALLAISRVDREANTRRMTIKAAEGALQTLPDSVLRLVSVDANGTGGRTIEHRSIESLDRQDACWRGATKVGYAEAWATDGKVFNEFWVYPPLATDDPLTVVYVPKPEPLRANAANIDLNAEYEQDLINYCLYRAYQREGTQTQKERFYRSAFYEGLGFKLQADLLEDQQAMAEQQGGR